MKSGKITLYNAKEEFVVSATYSGGRTAHKIITQWKNNVLYHWIFEGKYFLHYLPDDADADQSWGAVKRHKPRKEAVISKITRPPSVYGNLKTYDYK